MKLEQFVTRVENAFLRATHEPADLTDADRTVLASVHNRVPPGTAEQAVSEIISARDKAAKDAAAKSE